MPQPTQPTSMQDVVSRALPPGAGSWTDDGLSRTLADQGARLDSTENAVGLIIDRVQAVRADMGAVRQVSDALNASMTALEERVTKVEQRPSSSVSRWDDLLERLTSRVLWATFILPALGSLILGLTGSLTWMDAINRILIAGGAFGAVEGFRDVSANLKGHIAGPPPPTTPPQSE